MQQEFIQDHQRITCTGSTVTCNIPRKQIVTRRQVKPNVTKPLYKASQYCQGYLNMPTVFNSTATL